MSEEDREYTQEEIVNSAMEWLEESRCELDPQSLIPSSKAMDVAKELIGKIATRLLSERKEGQTPLVNAFADIDFDGGIQINGSFAGERGCLIARINKDGSIQEQKRIAWVDGVPVTTYEQF